MRSFSNGRDRREKRKQDVYKRQEEARDGSYMIALFKPNEKVLDAQGNRLSSIKVVGHFLPTVASVKVDMIGHWKKDARYGPVSYTHLNQDIPVLDFTCRRNEFDEPEFFEGTWHVDYRPIGYRGLAAFLEHRKAPKHREHIRQLLEQYGCDDLEGFLQVTRALSLNDTFWVKRQGEVLQWRDVSLYTCLLYTSTGAADDVERLLNRIAENSVTTEFERQRTEERTELAQSISYGDIHDGGSKTVQRIASVSEELKEEYQSIAGDLLHISKQLQKSVLQQMQDSRRGGKQTSLLMGRRLDAHALFRTDSRVFYKNALPNEMPALCVGPVSYTHLIR